MLADSHCGNGSTKEIGARFGLIADRVIDDVSPTENAVQDGPGDAVPMRIRDHHRKGRTEPEAV